MGKFGDNFEKSKKGFVDFVLLDAKGFPLIVLEVKTEIKNPPWVRSRHASTPARRTAASSSQLKVRPD
jgi:hypothetical protein